MKIKMKSVSIIFLAVLMIISSVFVTTPILGESNFSLIASAVSTPAQVRNLRASAKTYSTVTLKWDKASGAQKYIIYKYIKSENKYVKLGKSSSTSFKVENLKASTSYIFSVRAYMNINGNNYYGPYSVKLSVKTSAKPTLNLSSLSITTENKAKNLKLTWNKISGVSGYQVYRSVTGKSGSYKRIATLKSKTNTYRDTNLESSTVYYYAVRAYKKTSGAAKYGNFKKADLSTRLTKTYVDELWKEANKAYSNWLYSCAYADWDDYYIDSNGRYYFKVNHKIIKTVKDMKNFVKKYFAEDILNNSYLYNSYIDHNGRLYVSCDGVGSTMTYCKSTKLLSVSDKKCVYRRYCGDYMSDDRSEGKSETFIDDYTFIYRNHRWIMTGYFWPEC